MNSVDSISVVMPVHNGQDSLGASVERLLEDLSELSDRVQIVLVDDGSNDGTPEVADELRRRYPQVTTIRQPQRMGAANAVQMGLHVANGDLVFTQDSYDIVELHDIRQLWSFRNDPELVMARARTRTRRVDADLLNKLQHWGQRVEDQWLDKSAETSELKMYRREVVEGLVSGGTPNGQIEISHLSHRSVSSPFGARRVNHARSHAESSTL